MPLLPFFPPSICHEVMGSDAIILVFLMLSFKAAFSLFYFSFLTIPKMEVFLTISGVLDLIKLSMLT